MISPEDLIADWIAIHTTLKRQLDERRSGGEVRLPGIGSTQATADMIARFKTCLMMGVVLLVLLSACSSASPDFTPEQIRWGVGCRGPNAELYCGDR